MMLNIKYYPQFMDFSCGAACLRMVLGHYGKKISEERLITLLGASKKSWVSHKKVVSVVKKLGFVPYEYRNATIKDLINYLHKGTFPIINYLEPFSGKGHYAVVTGYSKKAKKIILADPRNGDDFTLKWDKFEKSWSNNAGSSKGWFLIIRRC